LQNLHTIHSRHLQVQNNGVRRFVRNSLQAILSTSHFGQAKPWLIEELPQDIARNVIVIHKKKSSWLDLFSQPPNLAQKDVRTIWFPEKDVSAVQGGNCGVVISAHGNDGRSFFIAPEISLVAAKEITDQRSLQIQVRDNGSRPVQ